MFRPLGIVVALMGASLSLVSLTFASDARQGPTAALDGWVAASRKVQPDALAAMKRSGRTRYVVTFGAGTTDTMSAAGRQVVRAAATGIVTALPAGAVMRTYEALPVLALRLTGAEARRIARMRDVKAVEIDHKVPLLDAESLPLVGGVAAQAYGKDGSGSLVAVIDTGIDTDHPELADDLVGQACYVYPSGCPNGAASQTGTGAAEAFAGKSHGTHVAGIVSANGTVGPKGLADGADIVAVDVFGVNATASYADILAGINYVVVNYPGTDAINTGYYLSSSNAVPAAGAAGWSATAPTTFNCVSAGSCTFYAWTKDAAGHVSTTASATVVVDVTAPTVTL